MTTIRNDLLKIGIAKGLSLEVHASMKSIGKDIDPQGVIGELKNVISPEGTIIMPAFPLSQALPLTPLDLSLGIAAKHKWLDENHNQRTDMGIIADTFSQSPGTVLGAGRHRMAAWGKNANRYVGDLMDFIDDSGHGLLVGVDIRKLTAMHYVESHIADAIWPQLFQPMNGQIQTTYNQDDFFIATEILPKYLKAWLKIQAMAERQGLITKAKIGNADSLFFNVKAVVGLYEHELRHNIAELFEI